MGHPGPIDWLVEGVLIAGERIVVYGESETCKSWLLMHLGLHLAAGWDWLGHRVPRPRRVLYVDEEMGERAVRQRGPLLIRGTGVPPDIPFRIVCDARFRASSAERSEQLLREVSGFDPEVIIVDSLRATLVGHENDDWHIQAFFDAVAPLHQHGRTLLVIHHMGKPAEDRSALQHRARGHSLLRDRVDTMYAVVREPLHNPVVNVVPIKMRNAETPRPFAFRLVVAGESATLIAHTANQNTSPIAPRPATSQAIAAGSRDSSSNSTTRTIIPTPSIVPSRLRSVR